MMSVASLSVRVVYSISALCVFTRSVLLFCFTAFFMQTGLCNGLSQTGQELVPRVERESKYAFTTTPAPGQEFHVPLGQQVHFYCFCQGYEQVQILQDGVPLSPARNCSTILLTIDNTSRSDEGEYMCRAWAEDGHMYDRLLGNLTTFDSKGAVQAMPVQYGQLNEPSSITCTSSLDTVAYGIVTTWYRREGESKFPMNIVGQQLTFSSTQYSNAGYYVCRVYVSAIDIKIERTVEFNVTDQISMMSTNPTETPPTSTYPESTSKSITDAISQPSEATDFPRTPQDMAKLITAVVVLSVLLSAITLSLLILCGYLVLRGNLRLRNCLDRDSEEKFLATAVYHANTVPLSDE